MSRRKIKLLHVEDEKVPQQIVAHMLGKIDDLEFAITVAQSEEDAMKQFEQERFELVILDYHLSQGNGLSCLRRMRERDEIVPVIALSAAATPEIAAELLRDGADLYLSKEELSDEQLAECVHSVLARADCWRLGATVG